jgi:hypothetical protein
MVKVHLEALEEEPVLAFILESISDFANFRVEKAESF